MKGGHRVLIAAQPGAWRVVQPMLADVADLVAAHAADEALRILQRDRISLILATVAFDESRMIDFLQAVKRTVPAGAIPFLCMRVLPGVISDNLVAALRETCKACGAIDLVDIAKLPPDSAQRALRAAVAACLEAGKPGDTN